MLKEWAIDFYVRIGLHERQGASSSNGPQTLFQPLSDIYLALFRMMLVGPTSIAQKLSLTLGQ